MLTFNISYDGGTFEESTPLQGFSCLTELREQALFQIDFYTMLDNYEMRLRYYKLMNYIEDRMRRVEG